MHKRFGYLPVSANPLGASIANAQLSIDVLRNGEHTLESMHVLTANWNFLFNG